MKYPEEDLAAELHRDLTAHFGHAPTVLSIEGAGVHWKCTAGRDEWECTIHCFATPAPQYFTRFERDGQTVATARFPSTAQTLDAVADWLAGNGVAALHARHPQVDKQKRALLQLAHDVSAAVPELQTAYELNHSLADSCTLQIAVGDRSCEVSLCGTHNVPTARFSWDGCELFACQPEDPQLLAALVRRWLCEAAPPSRMRAEFPSLEIGELADYYEQGRGIEGEFLESWNLIERFYQDLSSHGWEPISQAALGLIGAMREAGYDRVLRAGQSVYYLGLSRSRRHGLRPDQPCLWFDLAPNGATMKVQADFLGYGLMAHPVELTAEVREMLDELGKVTIG